ncbi:MAG: MFS transporter [Gemmatimonadales bacterium]|nr:MAG: MFS transporter [Gemmatimonadales bacterium]
MNERIHAVRERLQEYLRTAKPPTSLLAPEAHLSHQSGLTAGEAVALFEDQARSREIDVVSRELRQDNRSFYTISSAGHEQNAVVGSLLRLTDPCLLHYRSGGLMMARARKDPSVDPALDTLLGVVASREDPISRGRHKVWGSRPLQVIPQTSTIASQLPKAVGLAFAIERARRLGVPGDLPRDAIVCCSFGDASANHASALTAVNAARWSQRLGSPVPILFLCEDNQIGISVPTPRRWIEETFGEQSRLRYFLADGELDEVWDTVGQAIDVCRSARQPVFLHLRTVRLWGHAGSDVELGYRSLNEIRADEERDPLLRNARRLVETGAATPGQLVGILSRIREEVVEAGEHAASRPRLETREEVMTPLRPPDWGLLESTLPPAASQEQRRSHFDGTLPEEQEAPVRRTVAAHINAALHDELLRRPHTLVFGEDVGRKGGVYHVTAGLQKRFGKDRVFDSLLDETMILGIAQGAALRGFLPIPEIQYLAYIHNALDQLRGEAASLTFFSSGQFRNPMVVRVGSLAYQKGFGGHFHNDNSLGALRDIPGMVLAAPARGDDAARMLRGALAVAEATGSVVCFLEPIALYHERDLHLEGDEGWLTDYPSPDETLLPGEVGIYHPDASDLLIVTYSNGLRMALRAARRAEEAWGVRARVLDLRWLNPLPHEAILRNAHACGRVLVADECRRTGGGVADEVLSRLVQSGFRGPVSTVTSEDSFIPLGPAANLVLLDEERILAGIQGLAAEPDVLL